LSNTQGLVHVAKMSEPPNESCHNTMKFDSVPLGITPRHANATEDFKPDN